MWPVGLEPIGVFRPQKRTAWFSQPLFLLSLEGSPFVPTLCGLHHFVLLNNNICFLSVLDWRLIELNCMVLFLFFRTKNNLAYKQKGCVLEWKLASHLH